MRCSLVGLVVGLVACGASNNGGGGGGGDASTTVDGTTEGGTDAPPPPGLVRVHALATTGAPVMGLHAVFADVNATLIDTQTDSTGVAQATVSAGASVTLICDHNTHQQCPGVAALTTVQDLTPGDDVTLNVDAFGPRLIPLDTTSAGTFTINEANEPPSSGNIFGSKYIGPCGFVGNKTTTGTVTLAQGCVRSPMSLIIRYLDGAGGFYTAEKLAVPFVDGGAAVLSGPWVQDVSFAAAYSNLDTTTASVVANRFVPDLRGSIDATNVRRADAVSGSATPTIGHVGVATSAVVQSTFSTCTSMEVTTDASNGIDCVATHPSQVTTDAVGGTIANLSVDASTKLLPWVAAPGLVAANNILTVPPPVGTAPYTVAEVDLTYVRNGSDVYTWRIFERQLGDVHLPALPSTIPTDPTPRPTDTVPQTHTYIGRSSAIASWHDVVSSPYDALGACEASTDPTTKRFDVMSAAWSKSGY